MRSLSLVLVASLAGCLGHESAPARFYVLSATVRAEPAPAGVAGREGALAVAPAQVPDYLDRPQVVTFGSANEINVDEYHRWGEPTSSAVARVVAADLGALLPGWLVLVRPWDPSVPLRARLFLSVDELGWDRSGEARLKASWTLLAGPTATSAVRGQVDLRRKASGADTDAGAAAASELIGELSRSVAGAVRALPPAGAKQAGCP